jgi:hypothetical protein
MYKAKFQFNYKLIWAKPSEFGPNQVNLGQSIAVEFMIFSPV